ncbi:CPBP family intramembrane metalloprotease [Candidatus Micrarchaeota archaeon]|nr:CPBP family intramembrane metalloprotease [Candidatus Micrarchaeota archaeon]
MKSAGTLPNWKKPTALEGIFHALLFAAAYLLAASYSAQKSGISLPTADYSNLGTLAALFLIAVAEEVIFRFMLLRKSALSSLILDALLTPLFFTTDFTAFLFLCVLYFLRAVASSILTLRHGFRYSILMRAAILGLAWVSLISPALPSALFILLLAFAIQEMNGVRLGQALGKMGFSTGGLGGQFLDGLKLFAQLFLLLIIEAVALSYFGLADSEKVKAVLARQSLLTLAVAVFLSPIAEELLFRATLVPRVGVALSSIIFAALHIGFASAIEVVGALTAGILFGLYFKRNGKIIPAMVAHGLVNAYAVAVTFLAR